MAQDGFGAIRKDRRKPAAMRRQHRVTDRVHTALE
jgi:hypothetical protein